MEGSEEQSGGACELTSVAAFPLAAPFAPVSYGMVWLHVKKEQEHLTIH